MESALHGWVMGGKVLTNQGTGVKRGRTKKMRVRG